MPEPTKPENESAERLNRCIESNSIAEHGRLTAEARIPGLEREVQKWKDRAALEAQRHLDHGEVWMAEKADLERRLAAAEEALRRVDAEYTNHRDGVRARVCDTNIGYYVHQALSATAPRAPTARPPSPRRTALDTVRMMVHCDPKVAEQLPPHPYNSIHNCDAAKCRDAALTQAGGGEEH